MDLERVESRGQMEITASSLMPVRRLGSVYMQINLPDSV